MKVVSCLFSLLIVSFLSFGQAGMVVGLVGSKINDKAAWNKFKNEQVVSNTVLYGDTLFCLRTGEEGLNKLAGSNKYRNLSTAISTLERNFANCREQVLAGASIENKLSYNDELIERVLAADKKFEVDYYRREQAFYRQYQSQYASRQKAIADSISLAKEKERSMREEAAKSNPASATSSGDAGTVSTSTGTEILGNVDSAYVVTMYGSIKEYNEQYLFRHKSSHGHLVLFAGKNAGWVNELIGYLENKAWSVDKIGGVEGKRIFTMRGACYGCNANNWPRIDITMHYDPKTGKIQKMVLTGKDTNIERLFVEYWDIADIKFDQLMEKGIFYHDVLTDKISLVSKPQGSTLTITANPKVSMGN